MKFNFHRAAVGGVTARALLMAGLVLLDSQTLWAQSQADRDRKIRDFSGPGSDFHPQPGTTRLRTPTEMIRFRTLDGTLNNPVGIFWGAAGGNLRRRVPQDYADGVAAPSGRHRKPARSVSNYLCNQNLQDVPNQRGLTSMVWQWGQFLDHDITLTETADPAESFPILVPTGDRYFDPFGIGGQTIPMFRSRYRLGMADDVAREQVNSITSWIDASNVYGSADSTARSLRTLEQGRMRTSRGDLLPRDAAGFFLAGDIRANEQVGLTSMHTLFVREHNRIAAEIARRQPGLSDEQIFVRARKHVAALVQAITYQEFLPALMGDQAIAPYRGYNPLVFPNISNLFATAAYRFGHSMLPREVLRLDNSGAPIPAGPLSLQDAFFHPDYVAEQGIDPYLKGLTVQVAQEVDTKIVGDLRNFLFGAPGSGGFDLAALNIQRGRDHGLADFNSVRRFYRLPVYQSFDEVSSDLNVQFALSQAYQSVDDIDAWVGMLAEDHLPGSSLGETAQRVLKQQFEMLRDADRFWYQYDLDDASRKEIESTTLADVIQRNSGVRNLPRNVFRSVR